MAVTIRVVVPTFQAAAFIGACLEGLWRAGFAPADVQVVDDGSTDGTADIVRRSGAGCLALEANGGAARARNLGAAQCGGDVVLFVDADVVVAPDTRAVLGAVFAAHPEIDAVFGTYDGDPEAPGTVSRFRNLLHRHVHRESAGAAATFWTGLGAVRRAAFERAGGFDPAQAMMEDVKFGMALAACGGRIELLAALQGRHLKRWSLGAMLRTDLFDRAIPWARLLRAAERGLPRTLNVGWEARLSVLAVAVTLLSLLATAVVPVIGALCALGSILAMAGLNRKFLAGFAQSDGAGAAVAGVGLLWLHYLCGGLGYAWVRLRG